MAESIFDRVRSNIDIVQVVGEYVNLEPKGKNFFGICPFHDDHNASMSVSPELGIYTCFTCHESGDAIKFVSQYKNMSYIDATRLLAKEYHIDITDFRSVEYDRNQKYLEIMNISSRFFKYLMDDEEYSKNARDYLHKRGITDETIEEFGIGLSSRDKDSLQKTLIEKKFIPTDIELLGLSNGTNDIFVNRIIVPIRNEQGQPIAFGGRIYEDKDKGLNKYLNSKETPLFKKGETVFNLDKASKEMKNGGFLIINEGYMDVIQACSNGVKNSVAIMGTAMTNEQAQLIKKYTSNVVICLDGDKAGIHGVLNCIKRCEDTGINYSIVILKENKDPDEFIRTYGVNEYLNCINNERLDKAEYLYRLTKLDYPIVNSFNMDSFRRAMFENIKNETSASSVERILRTVAKDLGVSFESIEQDYFIYTGRTPRRENKVYKKDDDFKIEGAYSKAERLLLDYSIKNYHYFDIIERQMDDPSRHFMENETYRSIYIEIGDIYDLSSKTTSDDLILQLKSRGVYENYTYNPNVRFSTDDLYDNVIKTIKDKNKKLKVEKIKQMLNSSDINGAEYSKLIKEYQALKKELMKK